MTDQPEAPSSDEPIVLRVDAGVATLTLNRPDKLNAFTDPMLHALLKALRSCERDAAVRAIVLTGAGRAFSAGQDLGDVQERGHGLSFRAHLEATYNRIIRAMRQIEKPVIAAVNGVAAGAGASIAFACDIRLAAESAKFATAFGLVGLVPDSGATWFLPRFLGYARAFELYATGGRLTAAEALAFGVVNHVVPDDLLLERTHELAAKLAAGPTKAFGLTKRAMNRALSASLDSTLDYEAILQEIAGNTADHGEGVAAFLEKRPPRFVGA
ncbi:MAG: enoyl-CoA hydratase-related protein [Ardenticatenales bacterium]